LSFSGETGAPKKYCRFWSTSSLEGAKVRGWGCVLKSVMVLVEATGFFFLKGRASRYAN
jgi:hypothetical protein